MLSSSSSNPNANDSILRDWERLLFKCLELTTVYLSSHQNPSEGISRTMDTSTRKRLEVELNQIESVWSKQGQEQQQTQDNSNSLNKPRSSIGGSGDANMRFDFESVDFLDKPSFMLSISEIGRYQQSSSSSPSENKTTHRHHRNQERKRGKNGKITSSSSGGDPKFRHILACCEKWDDLYKKAFLLTQNLVRNCKEVHTSHLKSTWKQYRFRRDHLNRDFVKIIDDYVGAKSKLVSWTKVQNSKWFNMYRYFQADSFEWICQFQHYQTSILRVLSFDCDVDWICEGLMQLEVETSALLKNEIGDSEWSFHRDDPKTALLKSGPADALLIAPASSSAYHPPAQSSSSFHLFQFDSRVLKQIRTLAKKWNRFLTPACTKRLEHQRKVIRRCYEECTTKITIQTEIVQDWERKLVLLLEEEKYHLSKTSRVEDLTSDKMKMNIVVQEAIREIEPRWKAEATLLDAMIEEKKRVEPYFQSTSVSPPLRPWSKLAADFQVCSQLKHHIHKEYQTQTSVIMDRHHAESSDLIRRHIQNYAQNHETVNNYSASMLTNHCSFFNREWSLLKQEISLLEQHLSQFAESAWNNPDLFDHVQFLSTTLNQSTHMFEQYMRDVMYALRCFYAKKWISFMKQIIENEGELE